MKKAFYIESIHHYVAADHSTFVPVSQNASWIKNFWESHSLECIGLKQWSNRSWEVRLKGKKKNIQKFVSDFMIETSELYTIRETWW